MPQNAIRIVDDLATSNALDVRDEADSAIVMFVARIIQPVSLRVRRKVVETVLDTDYRGCLPWIRPLSCVPYDSQRTAWLKISLLARIKRVVKS